MIDVLVVLVGFALLHLVGGLLSALASGSRLLDTLRSPSSALLSLATLHFISLGPLGYGLLLAFAGATLLLRAPVARTPFPWLVFGIIAVLVLARPMTPTQWDELVWLAKARLESLGFGNSVKAALDPTQGLVPSGYPPLWPSAVGWLSLGRDSLTSHTLAATAMVLLALAAALEAWWHRLRDARWFALAALLAPLIWVHLRSTYLDLPVGLLGVALLGHLLTHSTRPPVIALAIAVVAAGLKDDGVTHTLAATIASLAIVAASRRKSWRLLLPAALAVATALGWRFLSTLSGVHDSDHDLGTAYWHWAPRLLTLVVLHASALSSWGIFWAVALAAFLMPTSDQQQRGLKVAMACNVAFMIVALLCGPERVRVFAENGTLINRLLVQLWPIGAVGVTLALAESPPR